MKLKLMKCLQRSIYRQGSKSIQSMCTNPSFPLEQVISDNHSITLKNKKIFSVGFISLFYQVQHLKITTQMLMKRVVRLSNLVCQVIFLTSARWRYIKQYKRNGDKPSFFFHSSATGDVSGFTSRKFLIPRHTICRIHHTILSCAKIPHTTTIVSPLEPIA